MNDLLAITENKTVQRTVSEGMKHRHYIFVSFTNVQLIKLTSICNRDELYNREDVANEQLGRTLCFLMLR